MSYVRVSIKGAIGTTDVWSINPVFDPSWEIESDVDQTKLDAACQAIANRTIPTGLRATMSTAVTRTGASLEVRANADDALLAISTAVSATSVTGLATPKNPPQCAIVASLRTDTPGASGRGRLYWPFMDGLLTGTGRVDTTVQTNFLNDMKSYMAGIDTDLSTQFVGITFDLAVRSRKTHTTPHVVRLQAGNVVDTQRRRRDAIPESYLTVAYP